MLSGPCCVAVFAVSNRVTLLRRGNAKLQNVTVNFSKIRGFEQTGVQKIWLYSHSVVAHPITTVGF
jgi:hypothetical protein